MRNPIMSLLATELHNGCAHHVFARRLASAHAKCHLRHIVTDDDAKASIDLLHYALVRASVGLVAAAHAGVSTARLILVPPRVRAVCRTP